MKSRPQSHTSTPALIPGANSTVIAVRPYKQALKAFTRSYWLAVLKETQGNVTAAARLTGRNRTHLYRALRHADIDLSAELPRRRYARRAGNWGELWDRP